jgi:hypothetical protein
VRLAFALLILTACKPDPPSRPSDEPEEVREPGVGGDPVVVIARVVEVPALPACGEQTFRVAIRYERVRVESGRFEPREFLVRQDCPERARESGDAGPIVAGAVHRLTLDPEPYRTARRVQWIPRRTDRAGP